MNIVHLHLLLNHIPVIGAVFGTLLLAVALLRRSGELAKTSLAFLALIGAMGVFVYLPASRPRKPSKNFPDSRSDLWTGTRMRRSLQRSSLERSVPWR